MSEEITETPILGIPVYHNPPVSIERTINIESVKEWIDFLESVKDSWIFDYTTQEVTKAYINILKAID